jgi:transposase-like protein
MGTRRIYRKFTTVQKQLAVLRMKECDDISALCREMGISRQLLYQWRDRLEREQQQRDPAKAKEQQLRQENEQLKKALAERTLQLDFLKGALQKVEALRQASTGSGATASTPKSGN